MTRPELQWLEPKEVVDDSSSIEMLLCREEMPPEIAMEPSSTEDETRHGNEVCRRSNKRRPISVAVAPPVASTSNSPDLAPVSLEERLDKSTKRMRVSEHTSLQAYYQPSPASSKYHPLSSTPNNKPRRNTGPLAAKAPSPAILSPVGLHKIQTRSPDEKEANEQEVLDFLGTVLESPLCVHKNTPRHTMQTRPLEETEASEQDTRTFLGAVLDEIDNDEFYDVRSCFGTVRPSYSY